MNTQTRTDSTKLWLIKGAITTSRGSLKDYAPILTALFEEVPITEVLRLLKGTAMFIGLRAVEYGEKLKETTGLEFAQVERAISEVNYLIWLFELATETGAPPQLVHHITLHDYKEVVSELDGLQDENEIKFIAKNIVETNIHPILAVITALITARDDWDSGLTTCVVFSTDIHPSVKYLTSVAGKLTSIK